MPTRKNLGLFVLVSALTTALSAALMLMAPLPARYLRLSFGRTAYWLFAVASSTALFFFSPAWALSQFILLLLIGLYTDLEQNKVPTFYAGVISVFFSSVSLFFLLGTWARSQQTSLVPLIKGYVETALQASQKIQQLPVHVTAEAVMGAFPALVSFVLMVMVCISVLFVKPQSKTEKISAFRAPDSLIWVFIMALAATFLLDVQKAFYVQTAASNLLYFCGAIYYFQGLAVAGFFLQKMRVNYFLKAGLFFVLAFHLFVFVAVLGLSDVWFSYRSKWYKKLLKDNPRRDV